VVLLLMPAGCKLFECQNTLLSEDLRPGGPYRAVVFVRSCGATTGWSTHVSLLGIKRFSNSDSGNVFVGEGGGPSSSGVAVRWVDRDTLEISHERNMVLLKSEAQWESVRILYAPY
jgi:hypothetical protein